MSTRFSPLPALLIVSGIQLFVAGALAYVAFVSSVRHQRTASTLARLERVAGVSSSVVNIAREESSKADKDFFIVSGLAGAIVAMAGFQVWITTEAKREHRGLLVAHEKKG